MQTALVTLAALAGLALTSWGAWRIAYWGHRKLDAKMTAEQLAMEPRDPWRD